MPDNSCHYPQCGTHQEMAGALIEVRSELKGIRSIGKWVLTAVIGMSGLVVIAIYSAGGMAKQIDHNTAQIHKLELRIERIQGP